jgi:hypothetical protein
MSIRSSIARLAVAGATGVALLIGGNTVSWATDAVSVLLCPFGCGPIDSDTVLMNQFIDERADVILLPQETPDYVYNIREMGRNRNKWKYSIFATEDTLIELAYAGGSPEFRAATRRRVQPSA